MEDQTTALDGHLKAQQMRHFYAADGGNFFQDGY